MEKAIRVQTKVGDVFKVANFLDPIYIQLVHIDPVQMNSDVAVVYKENNSENEFFLHTTIKDGIKKGLFIKTELLPRKIDLSSLRFKTYIEDYLDEDIQPYWYIWDCLMDKWEKVDEQEGKVFAAQDGGVYPAEDVIYRIKHGKSEFKLNWPSA